MKGDGEEMPIDENTLNVVLNDIQSQNRLIIQAQCFYLKSINIETDYISSMVISSVLNRGISLINAYISLANNKNYLSAFSLIRLQLDNALSLYAMTLVNDINAFSMHVFKGKTVNSYKVGEYKLTNSFLCKEMDKSFPGIRDLYKEMCNFIHFSNSFLFPISKIKKERTIEISVGNYDCVDIDNKIFSSLKMLNISQTLTSILYAIIQKSNLK